LSKGPATQSYVINSDIFLLEVFIQNSFSMAFPDTSHPMDIVLFMCRNFSRGHTLLPELGHTYVGLNSLISLPPSILERLILYPEFIFLENSL